MSKTTALPQSPSLTHKPLPTMNFSTLAQLAQKAPAALVDLQLELSSETKNGVSLDWPQVVLIKGATPTLNPTYRIRTDWPVWFRWHPQFWIKNLKTGDSVRVALNVESFDFYVTGRNYNP